MTSAEAVAEIGWVAREAIALAQGVSEDSERWRDFMARKRALLDHVESSQHV